MHQLSSVVVNQFFYSSYRLLTTESNMHIYMKIDKIPGNVTDKKHKGWIELESFNLGVHCPSVMLTGKMTDRQFSLPEFTAPMFTKKLDGSSGALRSLHHL